MKALRQISVQDCAAAILPGYELKFYGSGKNSGKQQLIESSAAFVEPCSIQSANNNNHGTPVVHGVVYTLSEEDFVKVGRTEGVPLAYRWQQCFVYPYVGDGEMAGQDAMTSSNCRSDPVEAYTLIAPPTQEQPRQQVAPSTSYLGLIREGAELWRFDRDYQDQLASVEPATNLIVSEGISGPSLQLAETAAGISRTYKIRVPNSYTSKKNIDT